MGAVSGGGATSRPTGGLVDRYGRVATDLRVSLTDRCNLRCTYCMPAEGLPWAPDDTVLTDAEVVRLVRIGVELLGVREVRFTGGEPLLRRGLEGIVGATAALRTADDVPVRTALTTNGLGLDKRAHALAAAGLGRVNVSLDSLDPQRFAVIARRDRHADVLAGLAAAAAAGLAPVKVNAVLVRGVNDDEAVPLLTWALAHGYHLRFIEQMPLGPHGSWRREDLVTAREILDTLSAAFELVAEPDGARAGAPAETWHVAGHPGATVGVIGSVTRPFCGACDRTRLTADGQVRSCLFARDEDDLRGLLRGGADDDAVADAWRAAMRGKAAGHGIDDPTFLQPARTMSAIGG
ncbi:GTP 3',8-cyclase MoaA [Cellulomonas sp. zg-ZUI199]|uniref:GTP 3',8-cyclase n=1 Tax=Cellulomonas wangleii TaxID=2816956 RepID=A0ABX8D924_9CELL|nr:MULTISPECIES: GTP 3',8-cyclase MoaA [Cellulomonas]MBO0900456.1 GTP 3',8-cyclase MoaA [Cellulomonas sp. zg-ZUI22]MBO0926421.1 GTP 3',8-cyclase MoaA [Cellulomonas wangleii]QVI63906.1 GTP 3',8-cyclase MoaA [Cellulomonas wangleii]